MPRLSKAVPSYSKHNATGQARVRINGRDYYLGPHGSRASKLEYDRIIGEWLASGRSPAFGKPSESITIAKLLLAYLTHAKDYYGDARNSEYSNMLHAVRPLKRLYADRWAAEFGPTELKAVRNCFVEAGNCRSHVNASTRRVVRVFRWAAGEGLLPVAVSQTLAVVPGLRKGRTEAPEGKKVRPVGADVVNKTLPFLSPIVRAMVEVEHLTGMRPGEVLIMRPRDIDRSDDVWEYKPSKHKTEHRELDRTVYIGPQAQQILLPYLLRPSDAFCFSPREAAKQRAEELSAKRKTPLSCGNRPGSNRVRSPKRQPGDRYTADSYRWAIYRACDRAFPAPGELARRKGETAAEWNSRLSDEQRDQLDEWQKAHRWSMNQLRHALGTRVRKEFDLESAKTVLGHSKANTTGIYAEMDRNKAIEVARKIG